MRRSAELMKDWKIPVPAELAGKIEMVLTDPLTRKPKYGARVKLIEGLLKNWLDQIAGTPEPQRHPIPSLDELRSM